MHKVNELEKTQKKIQGRIPVKTVYKTHMNFLL